MDLHCLPELLLPWYQNNLRALPWRADRLPYHVWISEIMLQQTRVEAVRGYYTRFLSELPDVSALADCDDDRLHKLWEGLGYYSRVRNLKKAAGIIMKDYGGAFPKRYEEVLSLPGIGAYTAGAICSICYEQPTPAVDGNVLRVVSRFTASRDSVSLPKTKQAFSEALTAVYPTGQCGQFTQALMELGATVCLPNGAPNCEACPLREKCASYPEALWKEIPVKEKKKARRIQEKTVLLLQCGNRFAIRKRADKGLLAGLWEFPNAEGTTDIQGALHLADEFGCHPSAPERSIALNHIFTHIEWHMTGHLITCREMPPQFLWVTREELEKAYSLPTAFRQFTVLIP